MANTCFSKIVQRLNLNIEVYPNLSSIIICFGKSGNIVMGYKWWLQKNEDDIRYKMIRWTGLPWRFAFSLSMKSSWKMQEWDRKKINRE